MIAAQARRQAVYGFQKECWRHASVLAGAEKVRCLRMVNMKHEPRARTQLLQLCTGTPQSCRKGLVPQRPIRCHGREARGELVFQSFGNQRSLTNCQLDRVHKLFVLQVVRKKLNKPLTLAEKVRSSVQAGALGMQSLHVWHRQSANSFEAMNTA